MNEIEFFLEFLIKIRKKVRKKWEKMSTKPRSTNSKKSVNMIFNPFFSIFFCFHKIQKILENSISYTMIVIIHPKYPQPKKKEYSFFHKSTENGLKILVYLPIEWATMTTGVLHLRTINSIVCLNSLKYLSLSSRKQGGTLQSYGQHTKLLSVYPKSWSSYIFPWIFRKFSQFCWYYKKILKKIYRKWFLIICFTVNNLIVTGWELPVLVDPLHKKEQNWNDLVLLYNLHLLYP